MDWISKSACVMVFLMSLLLIVTTGRTNTASHNRVQNSIKEIYEDRLVVKAIIYDLAKILHKKEIALASYDSQFFGRPNASLNAQADELVKEFRNTYLTDHEKQTLSRFSEGFEELKKLENTIGFNDQNKVKSATSTRLKSQIASLHVDLGTLSAIQLAEGKRKLGVSEKAVETMKLNESIENYSVIVIGILICAVMFVPKPRQEADQIAENS